MTSNIIIININNNYIFCLRSHIFALKVYSIKLFSYFILFYYFTFNILQIFYTVHANFLHHLILTSTKTCTDLILWTPTMLHNLDARNKTFHTRHTPTLTYHIDTHTVNNSATNTWPYFTTQIPHNTHHLSSSCWDRVYDSNLSQGRHLGMMISVTQQLYHLHMCFCVCG